MNKRVLVGIDPKIHAEILAESASEFRSVSAHINKLLKDHLNRVHDKQEDFAKAGIRSTTETEVTPTGLKTTVIPNKSDVKKFKKKITPDRSNKVTEIESEPVWADGKKIAKEWAQGAKKAVSGQCEHFMEPGFCRFTGCRNA
jgi:hypothetical protein